MLKYLVLAFFFYGCGDGMSTNDPNKPTQVVNLNGGVQIQIDHTAGRIFAWNKGTHAVGVVIADAKNKNHRIFARANIRAGSREEEDADLSARDVFGTVYTYKDDVDGLALGTLDTFGFNFEEHLREDWIIPPVNFTAFTIY